MHANRWCNRTGGNGVLSDMHTTTFDSPLGRLTLVASSQGLTRCTLRAVTVAADPAADDADEAAHGWLTQAAVSYTHLTLPTTPYV